MEPLTVGQAVTYVDPSGTQWPASVLEAYGMAALVQYNGTQTATARRVHFEEELGGFGTATPPYITDAPGGTDGTYETPVEEQDGP
jgi:hypothetical protein